MRAGLERAPEDVLSALLARSPHVVGVRAEALARRVDGSALVGLILLGVVSPVLPVPDTALQAALADGGAEGLDARRQAVARGRKLYDALPSRIAAARDRAG
jgi:hypothetical protein